MERRLSKAIYPGTFDPVTRGHVDIARRALKIFDELVIAVAVNEEKKPMFTLEKRIDMMKKCFEDDRRVTVKPFGTLLVEFAKEQGCGTIIRGLRAVSDFEYELQIGYANQSLDETIETVYLMPSLHYAFISSSVVRSILRYNGDAKHLVPPQVQSDLLCI
jgi:pantetheine-phosphate adenylyltransferase